IWEWTATPPESMFATFISGVRRLKNGNTLITDGPSGELLEVTPSKELVWRYVVPVRSIGPYIQGALPTGNQVFKAFHFDPEYSAFSGHDLTPVSAIELNPVTIAEAGPIPESPRGNDSVIAITAFATADLGLNSIDAVVDTGAGFVHFPMFDDGLNSDGLAGDGQYGVLIGAHEDGKRIEYYFEAVDDTAAVIFDPPNPVLSVYRFTVGYSCGNIDGSTTAGNPTDISDLTYLVDFLFAGGSPPVDLTAANIDGQSSGGLPVDISDLTYLVAFVFGGGPAPVCEQSEI
ncbi:MAG: hypothetical protein P1R58_03605, partial [bacterium]|nr:hypothetical protein [bacterium]